MLIFPHSWLEGKEAAERSVSELIYYEDIQDKLREIDEHIKKEYIASHPKQDRDWRTYEQQFSKRIKEVMASLDPLIHEAVSTIKIEPKAGRAVEKARVPMRFQAHGSLIKNVPLLRFEFEIGEGCI